MPRPDPQEIDRLIERILDAEPADWPPLEARTSGLQRELEALQTVSDIARAFRRMDAKPRAVPDSVQFRWGHLAVLEKVASGGSADIYRAWDAGLGCHVALKLLRDDSSTSTARRFLDEAGRLARIRHHNVLSVYGAASHDGRPGLWCDWIDGHTLTAQIVEQGSMGPDETIVLGIALCRALAAVHAAGLLHGDVKPDNILRERGGRIVLADLGAGGEPAAVNASLRSEATPAWLAPEVLAGAMRTPQQDLFALGGVLQYVLGARVPDPARLGAHLDRADVPAALRGVIERARSADPAQRFAHAQEMEHALLACLASPANPSPSGGGLRRGLLLAAALAMIAALATGLWPRVPQSLPLDVEVSLQRQRGESVETINDGAAVTLGDRLSFRTHGNQAVWLYIYNADDRGELQQLFPLRGLDTSNPLPAGRGVEIPGRAQGQVMRFEVSSSANAEDFLLVASAAPVESLEAMNLANAQIQDEVNPRGTARLVAATPKLPGTRLDSMAAELAAADPSLRLWRFRLPHQDRPVGD